MGLPQNGTYWLQNSFTSEYAALTTNVVGTVLTATSDKKEKGTKWIVTLTDDQNYIFENEDQKTLFASIQPGTPFQKEPVTGQRAEKEFALQSTHGGDAYTIGAVGSSYYWGFEKVSPGVTADVVLRPNAADTRNQWFFTNAESD